MPFDVTIAGEINLDLILYGLPETMAVDRELLASNFEGTLGSSSGILAHNLSVLGAKVGFITKIGTDAFGKLALRMLQDSGVDVSGVLTSKDEQKTGITILLHHGGTRHILTYPGVMTEMRVDELDTSYLAQSRHFHISSLYLQKSLHQGLPELCRTLKAKGLTLSLDTNDDPENTWSEPLEELLHLVDIFLPNDDEAKRMTGTSSVEEAATVLAAKGPIVAIKCGANGSFVQQGNQRWYAAPRMVQPVDTIGAGDSFNAGFLSAFLAGRSLQACAEQGNVTAALSTQRPGGIQAFLDEGLRRQFLER